MDKKDFTVTLLVIGLTITFALASSALFLSRGKSKFWTAKKMRLGAMIIALTTFAASQKACITCYDPAVPAEPENSMYLSLKDTINLNDSTRIVKGEINNRISTDFSYRLINDTIDTLTYSDNIFADDGVFDDYFEPFTIDLDTAVQPGQYIFQLFDVAKEKQDSVEYPQYEYYTNIIKE